MDHETRDDLMRRMLTAIEFLNRRLYLGRAEMMGGQELTMQQVKALLLLESGGAMNMTRLAIMLDKSLSTTGSMVDRLVERSLVERRADPGDRRLVICDVTEAGRGLIKDTFSVGAERLKLVAEMMTDEELSVATRGLELLSAAEERIMQTFVDVNVEMLARPNAFAAEQSSRFQGTPTSDQDPDPASDA